MTEMIMRTGAKMPEKMLMQELKRQVDSHLENPNYQTRSKICTLCMMVVSRMAETECGGIDKIIDETNETQALANLLKPKDKN